jgi:hypothetical protein
MQCILERVTAEDPATVLRVVASLVPKELAPKLEAGADSEKGIVINLMGVAPAVVPEPIDITPDTLRDIESPDNDNFDAAK